VSCGYNFGAYLTAKRELFLISSVKDPLTWSHWFSNLFQTRPNGNEGSEDWPPRVLLTKDVKEFTAGLDHIAYLKGDGTLWCVGRNNKGQLGTGDAKDRRMPVEISLPGNVA